MDDEEHNLHSFRASFRRDFEIFTANSGAQGLEVFKEEHPEVIITDQRMPKMTGIEFLVELQKINSAPMRMLLTGYSDINAVVDSVNKGQVYRYMSKPWDANELKIAVNSAYEVYQLRLQNAQLLKDLELANQQLEFLLRQRLLS